MHTFRRPALVALCLTLSACGSAPAPTQLLPDAPTPAETATGGGGGEALPAPDDPGEPAEEAPQTVATATPEPSVAPSAAASATPPAGSGGSRSSRAPEASPSATPSPAASATPTPSPSATASPTAERTLVVAGDRHLVELKSGKAFGTSPFTIASITTEAYNNKAAGVKFTALAGATRGRYGWRYGRITAENASEWGGDIGGPGTVFFLDSAGGEADNDGSWVVTERHDDGTQVHTQRTEILAKTDVCTFDPAKVAFANLGTTATSWRVSAQWQNAEQAPYTYPGGCFVVFTRPDGVRDFAIVGPGETTLQARGYVYAFFITQSPERPDGDLALTLTPH